MDYGAGGIRSGDLSQHTFYIRENTAYNVAILATISGGVEWRNWVNGKSDKTPLYDFGPGTYGRAGLFDSEGDQRAIHRGYANSPKGAMLIKRELMNWPKYNPK
jgi:hypothetical protein